MKDQLPLLPFDGQPRARTETSYRAAVKAAPKAGSRREAALTMYRDYGSRGLTDYELADKLGIPIQSAVPLRTALRDSGEVVRDWGRARKNRYGNDCQVWRAV